MARRLKIVGTVKKSTDTNVLTWLLREVRQICEGGLRSRTMYFATLVCIHRSEPLARDYSDQLMFSLGGKGAVPMITLSETSFFFPGGFPVDFVQDGKGTITHFLLHAPCGDFKFVRTETAGK